MTFDNEAMFLHRPRPFLEALFPHHNDPDSVLTQSLGNTIFIHQTLIALVQSLHIDTDQQFRALLDNLTDLEQSDRLQSADGALQIRVILVSIP